jgi:hypothetical protein
LRHQEANRLVTDLDATLGEQLFDVTVAQVKPEVQPDSVADDLGREAMASVQGGSTGTTRAYPPMPAPNLINP